MIIGIGYVHSKTLYHENISLFVGEYLFFMVRVPQGRGYQNPLGCLL